MNEVKRNNLPSNKEPTSGCQYNKGVSCYVPIQSRQCNKCGWRPNVSKRRLEKILEKRQEALRNA